MITNGNANDSNKENEMTTTTLTIKEQDLYAAIQEGMDEPNCGWLHEIAGNVVSAGEEWANNDHAVAAVLGSLIEKGLVTSEEHVDEEVSYWVAVKNC